MGNAAPEPLTRSPELMSVGDTALLVIDIQEKLLPAIDGGGRVVWNARRLIDGAKLLDVPIAATEQYPRGLGPTVPILVERLTERPSKLSFSCGGCPGLFDAWEALGVGKLLVCGMETHVCVQQTVLDLLGYGWRVYVAVDAVGSRYPLDHRTALERMSASGATLTTTEAALFELCQTAAAPQFKEISRLVRELPPDASPV
ncbi:MAG: hydrolase [Planctomycetota bacterium]